MNVSAILELARNETHTTSAQYPDATIISWLNIVYKRVVRKIMTEADENFFHATKTFTATTASSYALEADFGQLKNLKVKYGTTTEYTPSLEVDFSVQPHDYEYYALSQPTSLPIHQIIGTSLYIAPRFVASTINGTDQIVYEYDKTQDELLTTTTGTQMGLPVDWHYVLVKGLKPMIFAGLGKTNEKNDATVEFENELKDVLYLMRGHDDTRNNLKVPNDQALQ
jgi:hypothetical protein